MNFDPGPLADATVEEADGHWTLVFVRDLRHPPERVWAALTDPDQLDAWAPFRPDRDLSGTGPATLVMVDGDTHVPLDATIHRAEPPHRLEYTWGTDLLRWDLTPNGPTGTRLTLRHTVSGREWLAKVAAGWHLCVTVAERLLDGEPVGPIRGAAARDHGWQELHDAYATKFGQT